MISESRIMRVGQGGVLSSRSRSTPGNVLHQLKMLYENDSKINEKQLMVSLFFNGQDKENYNKPYQNLVEGSDSIL